MLDKWLRRPKERILSIAARPSLAWIHPTAVTLLAFGVGLGASALAWQRLYGLALGLWLLNRILDGLDGTLARVYNKQSDLGGYLDLVLDFVVYAALPLGLALGIDTREGYLSLAVLLGSFYVNAASWLVLAALLEKRQQGSSGQLTSIAMPAGLIEGSETIGFYVLFLLFPDRILLLFAIMGILVVLTAMQRVVWAISHLR